MGGEGAGPEVREGGSESGEGLSCCMLKDPGHRTAAVLEGCHTTVTEARPDRHVPLTLFLVHEWMNKQMATLPDESLAGSLAVRQLSVYYGDKKALGPVTMTIPGKQVTALIGPSGCGKSTFLRSLNRMNEMIPDCRVEGVVKLDDESIYGQGVDAVAVRRRIGMVFQKSNPFPKSIYDNVAYGLRLGGMKDRSELGDRVEGALKHAALWDEVKNRLHDSALGLSGGQQQRLCIARALAVEPNVILMDEPASALDPIATAHIEELIHELARDYTVVIVTHNMQQAARVSHNTAFFYMGDLIEFDTTQIIFTKPSQSRTEDYITGRFG